MRDRLIELVDAFVEKVDVKEWYSEELDEHLADYLLKNGVIVPLCKVGDTVYQTDGIRIYELEVFDIYWRKNKLYYETESIDFDDTAIGERIFLTREEAEKALERSENGKS